MASTKSFPGVLIQEIGGHRGVMEEHVDFLKMRFSLITMKEFQENKEELAEKILCIFVWGAKPEIDYKLLKSLPKLKVIVNSGVGVDHLDLQLISSLGVKLANTPDAVSNATADTAMMLLLASARNVLQGYQIAVSPQTEHFTLNWVSEEVTGATLGIIGMGRIGYKIAERAKAFEMKILYHNRNQRLEEERAVGASYCKSLGDLLQQPDFVLLAVPLTQDTQKLIGKKELQLMKPSATLINISRGLVVDQMALVEALQNGDIRAAALDVTYPEPLPRDHQLLKLSNVILTPHIGSATRSTRRIMMETMVQSMLDAVAGRQVSNEVITQ
ncbi:glyoxylate/hydroxypyruvate reductase B-like [Spea bombifrons]|uniref:glyoxylate/hydroxypyruvate reductase B-like n=1 Tax=Spea bombifrons TaxID=233779 RepID=UPI00234A7F9C|nr:glyoxylate/hydroxypyruvate reductase B-like [Spea bombifrons]XP_053323081.1 glyoxylate/hydroxypyruvate reductase B-like [Spea bombifrons]